MMQITNNVFPQLPKIGLILCSYTFLQNIIEQFGNTRVSAVIRKGVVSFQNVSFRYPSIRQTPLVLRNLTLTIAGGEHVAVLGSSGSGKTTLMKLLCGLYTPTSGTVLIDGTPIQRIPTSYLRKRIIYINQRTHLFNRSLLKNIQYGNTASATDIQALLNEYELNTTFSKLSKGIHTNVGVNGTNLSLGMQKVVMIVRGLLKPQGQLFILDEPLAGLDATTRKKIIRLIRETCKGKTCIVVTHDTEILPYMDRVIDLNEMQRPTRRSPTNAAMR